jgi:hypothetical protein
MTDLQAQIDIAAARRAADVAKLQREDGTRRYSPDEHQERLQAINSRFREELDGIRETAHVEISEAETRLQQIQGSDTLDALSPDELSSAGARASFVREEVEGMDHERLRNRLVAVTAGSDKPLMATYFHYVRRRVAENPAVGLLLHDELGVLEEKLGRGEALREAQSRLERLREADQYAALKRQGHSSILQRHMDETYGSLAGVVRR